MKSYKLFKKQERQRQQPRILTEYMEKKGVKENTFSHLQKKEEIWQEEKNVTRDAT